MTWAITIFVALAGGITALLWMIDHKLGEILGALQEIAAKEP